MYGRRYSWWGASGCSGILLGLDGAFQFACRAMVDGEFDFVSYHADCGAVAHNASHLHTTEAKLRQYLERFQAKSNQKRIKVDGLVV